MSIITDILERWRNLDSRTRLWSGYGLIGLLVIVMLWSALAARTADLERKRAAREAVLKELLPLKVAYRAAKQSSDLLKGRMASMRPDDSPGQAHRGDRHQGQGAQDCAGQGRGAGRVHRGCRRCAH